MSITRFIVRWSLIGGLALGGMTLLVGPERVCAGLAMIRGKTQSIVDNMVEDPVALRRQLRELADQYPDRIAEVRGEIAQVNHQVGQFERDVEIASRVVAMTTEDLHELKALVSRAEDHNSTSAQTAFVRFEGVKFDVDEAYTEARRINNVRGTYQDRLANDTQQLAFLKEQNGRLSEILGKLESEYSTFQAQLWQLDRQIDAIERNDRLIELTEHQQATLAGYEKFGKVGSLKQLEAKLAELRAEQEAQLDFLSKRGVNMNYEKKAEFDVDSKSIESNPFDEIDIDYNSESEDETKEASKTLAFKDQVVFE